MYDFIAIDFETASSENNSACSLGMVFVKDLEIVDTKYYLIQPPNLIFDEFNIKVHDITPEKVKNEPTFHVIWKQIKHYFINENLIVAHNAQFDMSVLYCCLKFYNLEMPSFFYSDSISISTKICSGKIGNSLKNRAEFFNINMDEHHNALSDAITCARIVIETIKNSKQQEFETYIIENSIKTNHFKWLKPNDKMLKARLFNKIEYSKLSPTEEVVNNHFFSSKNIVITGDFKGFERKSLIQKLVNLGAIIKSGVTLQTNILLVGNYENNAFIKDKISTKEKKALSLIDKGQDIEIINEEKLLQLLST